MELGFRVENLLRLNASHVSGLGGERVDCEDIPGFICFSRCSYSWQMPFMASPTVSKSLKVLVLLLAVNHPEENAPPKKHQN